MLNYLVLCCYSRTTNGQQPHSGTDEDEKKNDQYVMGKNMVMAGEDRKMVKPLVRAGLTGNDFFVAGK